jgi:DNA-binding SARP family transcriptional activator/tetratricopeptide (TPR) repeat protein
MPAHPSKTELPHAGHLELGVGPRGDAPGAPAVWLRVLGEFALLHGGDAVVPALWRRTHPRRLMQYLCSSPRGSETQRRLLAALWPGADEARARNRLHHTLHGVRKAFETLPATLRPTVFVQDERVQLVLPLGVGLDWAEHASVIEADERDAAARLRALDATFERHGGDLAPDWIGQAEIDARRAWLAERRNRALQEAVALARELGDDETAIRLARQRARGQPDDLQVQGEFALLLRDCGRAEAALLHCTHLRRQVERDDPPALAQVDALIREIQKRSNEALATHAATVAATPPALLSRHALPAPRTPLKGYGTLLGATGRLLRDPYGSVLALVGPPGAGKSLLARHAAYQWQGAFRHGAVAVHLEDKGAGSDGEAAGDPGLLGTALAQALEPLVGEVAATPAALHAALAGRELLIVVDGHVDRPAVVEALQQLTQRHAEVRWLVATRVPLGLRGERCLRVDPALLLDAEQDGAPTPAAQILAARLALAPATGPAPAWPLLERVAQLAEGLPRALELAAERLETLAPSELLVRLQADPAALLRGSPAGSAFAAEAQQWLGDAAAHDQDTLAVLSACSGWLTRDDLQALHGGSADELDAFIEQATRRHHLCRRVRCTERGSRSEFRVSRLVLAATALGERAATPDGRERFAAWIERGPGGPHAAAGSRSAWFDERRADVDAVVRAWCEQRAFGRLLSFCEQHLQAWSLTQHPATVEAWLDAALAHAGPAVQARLLLARARLRLRRQQPLAACDDARDALQRLGTAVADAPLREEALRLLQRHGAAPEAALPPPDAVGRRGIEAAEELMRVARLAVQHRRYAQALAVCQQSIDLYTRFGVAHGQVRAWRYRARIALAAGQLDDAARALDAAAEVPLPAHRRDALARIELARADLELNRGRFDAARERAQAVLSDAEWGAQDLIAAHGLHTLAWVAFAQDTLPVALGLCREGHRLALGAAHAALLGSAHMLEALIDARQGRAETALQHVGAALERLEVDRPAADLQFELANAVELALLLGRMPLALRLLDALQAFGDAPPQRLRPWIAQRIDRLAAQAAAGRAAASAGAGGGTGAPLWHPADALRQLLAL